MQSRGVARILAVLYFVALVILAGWQLWWASQ
jgi:hypothetical protein